VILFEFPDIFAEFRGKQFSLLWRGSRDGFGAHDFHRLCDHHPNTLTVIQDTDGNIFGGFTPVEWDSRLRLWRWDGIDCCKSDPSLKSFLFTIKNPHNFPARIFPLKPEGMKYAIYSEAESGPDFVDIGANTSPRTSRVRPRPGEWFGQYYTNDTGYDGVSFFTNSLVFTVREVEVFYIIS
jgi:hypothetical protein